MQKHVSIRYKTRHKIPGEPCLCERCNKYTIVDIHHILSSFHAKRKQQNDGTDIIGLCRLCHDEVHSHNNFETRESLLNIVAEILENIHEKEFKRR